MAVWTYVSIKYSIADVLNFCTYISKFPKIKFPKPNCVPVINGSIINSNNSSIINNNSSIINSINSSIINSINSSIIFFFLALQPPLGVAFYSPLVGFSLLACEVS